MHYHVFLSFRGPDSRKTFTDHLYAALVRKGIVTFRDDLEIDEGEYVPEKLRKAIRQSRYFIIVLSKEFASSRWCLAELQQIVETKPEQTIFPVFYDVEPGYIGYDGGGKLEQHQRYYEEQIEPWREALSKVAKIKGWRTQNKHEAKIVEAIAAHIWNKLCDKLPSNFEYLVGDTQSKAQRLISLLKIGLDEKRFIGIWGMGGAGKTTLGRVVFDTVKKKGNFDGSCFLADIREDSNKFGLVHLQKKLLSNLKLGEPNRIKDSFHGAEIIRTFLCDKKVLIVLDDVSHRSQLDNLARNEDWFGAGSKIVITTRDKHLLTQYKDFDVCKVDMLCHEESLKLLHQKAFKKGQTREEFSQLSDKVVQYAGGHPLALEVLGSFLCTREENEWRCTIDGIRKNLNKEILSQLRISFDELEEEYKTIFLDIACFFNKEAKFEVADMLKICDLDERVGIKVLTEKSLLSSSQSKLLSNQTVRERQNMHDSLQRLRVTTGMGACLYKALQEEASKEYLYMHDLLQEMGKNIVFQECRVNAGRRSRLWSLEDINHALIENKGTKHVQTIVLETQEGLRVDWDSDCFSKMINLRLLDLRNVHLESDDELRSLPASLKFLRWDGYAKNCLPFSKNLRNLESIQLCNSRIRTLWRENMPLNKLRIINMSDSESLNETPDFSGTPNLAELLLNGCRNLTKVHESVAKLNKLVKLSLQNCRKLEDLPHKLETDGLQELILTGCLGLEKLPNFGEGMKSLYFLNVSGTSIRQIPSSISNVESLKILDLWDCNKLESLPAALPSSLIACPSNNPKLKDAIALLDPSKSRVPELRPRNLQGPIHKFDELKAGETISKWFEQREYYWGKDTSGEFVALTADIPSNIVADSNNEECWGIAICLFLKSLSQDWQSYIVWTFQGRCDTELTKTDGILTPYDDCGWGLYVGFYPFDKEQCRPDQSDGETSKLDLTISVLTTSTDRDLRDLAIMGCGWRLTRKPDFDTWWDNRELSSPSGSHGSRNRGEKAAAVTPVKSKLQPHQHFRKRGKAAAALPEGKEKENPLGFGVGEALPPLGSATWEGKRKSPEIHLQKDPKYRPSAQDLMGQPWVNLYGDSDADLSDYFKNAGSPLATVPTSTGTSISTLLVGDAKSKVDSMFLLSKMELNDTCFIGICGESGIGKTTLARLVYDEIRSKFHAACFLDNVRDSERAGIVSIQKKLISELGFGERDIDDSFEGAKIIRTFLCHKKVLIILDDVSQSCQLENLAGNKEWFGAGSKIVITTRDKTLCSRYKQFEEYEVGRLQPDESLKLLCLEAFKKDEPDEGYSDFSKAIVEYASGLPLVLKVLGSFLWKKDTNEWRNASERLRQHSPTDICSQLRICYDGLENEEHKRIFLDIACFFNGEPKFKVTNILESCGHHGTNGIEVLIEKSMLNVTCSNSDLWQNAKQDQAMLDRIQNMRRDIFLPTHLYDWLLQEASKEYLYMYGLLQEMGRNLVSQESLTDAGGRSRLWSLEDINDVLKENKGTENVESIVLYKQQSVEADWHPDCFSNMKKLRLLDLSKVHLSRNLNSLPSASKIIRWDYYALESLPPLDQLHELESLQFCNSKIRELWNGAPALDKLRFIDLSDSECLETPDFSGTPNLEELLLNRCRKLVQVHESVGQLKKLVMLCLQDCTRLESLLTKLETDNLSELILSGCLKLEKLPEFGRNMGKLYFLDVRGTDISEIPQSVIHLSNLKFLDLTFCSRLKSIPKLPPNLIISASNCGLLEPTFALRHLYASCTPEGPIHLFHDFQLWTRIPAWFEQWEYCWGKDTSGELVTIKADIPSDIADSETQCWGIAVCVVSQFISKAWLGFSVNWNFKDELHRKKTKIHGTPAYYMHDCRVYIGFYPFEAKDCRQHASGEGSQLDLTLEFPATNIVKGLHDSKIMGCGWRLACKKDFDEWSEESRVPSPLSLDFLNRERGERSKNTITE